MRTVIGYCAIALGVAGVLLAVASGAAVWPAGAAVSERTDEVTTNVNRHLDEAEPILNRLEQRVSRIATAVDEVGAASEGVAEGTAKDDPELAGRIRELRQNLAPLMSQAESLGQSLQSVGVLLKSSAELGSKFGQSPSKTDQLLTIAEALSDAAKILARINEDLEAFQAGKAVPDAGKIAEIASRAGPPLDRLARGLSDVRQQADLLQSELTELRDEVRFWSVAGPPVIDLFLLWFGLGQLCLIRWGSSALGAGKPRQGQQTTQGPVA